MKSLRMCAWRAARTAHAPGDRLFSATSISGARDRRTVPCGRMPPSTACSTHHAVSKPQDWPGNHGAGLHSNARVCPAPWRLSSRQRAPRTLLAASGIAGSSGLRLAGVPVAVADQIVEVILPSGVAGPVKDCPRAGEQGRCSDGHA
jgi:hypothetical protein